MKKDTRKILLVAYGGGHVAMLAPIWKALEANGYRTVFLALTTAQEYLSRLNIPYIGFRDLPSSDDIDVLRYGEMLAKELLDGKISNEETISYLGQSFRDLVLQFGERQAENIYREYGRHGFLPTHTLKQAIQMIAPDVVVTTNAPRSERAAIIAAGECGIPSVCVVDLYPSKEIDWLCQRGFAQKICVLNNSVKEILVANGRPAADVVVTGNPAFDRHYSFDQYQMVALAKRESFLNRPVVGFASNLISPTESLEDEKVSDVSREVFERVRRLCLEKGYALALRQHPSEFEWVDIGCAINCIYWDLDLYLASLDVLITFPSTIALEAQIYGVRTVVLDFTHLSQTAPYIYNGEFEIIHRVEDVDEINVSAGKNKASRHKTKTTATQNICDAIVNLI